MYNEMYVKLPLRLQDSSENMQIEIEQSLFMNKFIEGQLVSIWSIKFPGRIPRIINYHRHFIIHFILCKKLRTWLLLEEI
jgi:hypothetical protein